MKLKLLGAITVSALLLGGCSQHQLKRGGQVAGVLGVLSAIKQSSETATTNKTIAKETKVDNNKKQQAKKELHRKHCPKGLVGGYSLEANNPYNLVGKCMDEMFQVEQHISRTETYALLYSHTSGKIRTKARVIILTDEPIETILRLTTGLYKVIRVEQHRLNSGASVAIPVLKEINTNK